ncbi:MAG TPA: hypothetical protein PL166_15090 [Candidatus Contendobacter sp.]|nr:hypothetical protein [Candidatus Contendobacter sp.]HRD50903.1 hypothetical protein [Candidatus Contendobacter sp.]
MRQAASFEEDQDALWGKLTLEKQAAIKQMILAMLPATLSK